MSDQTVAGGPRNTIAIYSALSLLAICAGLLGLVSGAVDLTLQDMLVALGLQESSASDTTSQTIILDLRLPRIALALLVGGALACAGTAMQGLFRNPLADPGLVGVAGGAALAAVTMIVGAQHLHIPARLLPFATPFAAFIGGLAAALLASRLASTEGYTRSATLLLAGLAINSIAGAGVGLLTQVAGDSALREAMFWLFGSLSKSGWDELAVAAPILIATLFLIPRDARALNALLLGETEAMHLGVDVERLKRRIIVLIVISVATCVALAGVIGFVGLVVPHLLRLLLGPDHVRLIPASALGGAALLALADWAARTIVSPAELPIGILTALIGGPFFLALLIQLRGRVETWS
jgi:iron complex transport system permease protein